MILAALLLLLTAAAVPVAASSPGGLDTLVPYGAGGYRFAEVNMDDVPDFAQPGFDDSAFGDGTAAFGTSGGCVGDESIVTAWAPLTDLLLRRTVAVPDDGRELQLAISATGSVDVFVNGTSITGGLVDVDQEGCPRRPEIQLTVPEALLLRGADNLIAVRARSLPFAAFFDLTALLVPVPANDDVADATAIGALPFEEQTTLLAATLEDGEPTTACAYSGTCRTAWYAFTPEADGSYWLDGKIGESGEDGEDLGLAVYTGAPFGDLATVALRQARESWHPIVFHATAGTTYLIQVAGWSPMSWAGGVATVTLAVAPDPVVEIIRSPGGTVTTATATYLRADVWDPTYARIASFAWDFGDGTASDGESASHYFKATGDLEVRLTVTLEDGRQGSDTEPITVTQFVGPPPTADFGWTPETPDLITTVWFDGTGDDPVGIGIERWDWSFDDGATATGEEVWHRFETAGPHDVMLTVTTFDGRTATVTKSITIAPPPDPVADFWYWPTNPWAGQQVWFANYSYDPASLGFTGIAWDFGDGTTSNELSPYHAFAAPGTYTVSLAVTTPDGRSGTTTRSVTVDPPPPPYVYLYLDTWDPSVHDTIQFSDASWDPAGIGIVSRTWDFGDGVTSVDQYPTHRYAADGDYTVSLTVRTADGREASTSLVIGVRTHDVAIVRLVTAKAASAGQTKPVLVDLTSRYAIETVVVQLLRSTPRGYDVVGEQVVIVNRGKTLRVTFDYGFTTDDASRGRVTFKAVATLQGYRDALAADNEAMSTPTKVSR